MVSRTTLDPELDGRAGHGAVTAKHATVARLWSEMRVAAATFIKEPAGVGGHRFLRLQSTFGAGNNGLQHRFLTARHAPRPRPRSPTIPQGRKEQAAESPVKSRRRRIAVKHVCECRRTENPEEQWANGTMPAKAHGQADHSESDKALKYIEHDPLELTQSAKSHRGAQTCKKREATRCRDGGEERANSSDPVKSGEKTIHRN